MCKQKMYKSLYHNFSLTAIITELLRKKRLVVDNVIHCFHLPVLLHFYNFEDRSIFFSRKWSEKTSLQSDGKEMKSLSGNLFFFNFSKMSSSKMTVLIKLCDVIAPVPKVWIHFWWLVYNRMVALFNYRQYIFL